jgi:hypothetical protein
MPAKTTLEIAPSSDEESPHSHLACHPSTQANNQLSTRNKEMPRLDLNFGVLMLANLQLSIQFNVHTHILSTLKKERGRGETFFLLQFKRNTHNKHIERLYTAGPMNDRRIISAASASHTRPVYASMPS